MGNSWEIPSGDVSSLRLKPWPSRNDVSVFSNNNDGSFHNHVKLPEGYVKIAIEAMAQSK